MIGSCTSCLYTSIEIHWTAPSSSSCYFQTKMEGSLTPLSVHFQMSQHWSCNHCPCWGRCSPKCRRWWSHSRACCHRGRPCPCRPSAASSGCTTPWAPRCSESSPPSRWATRLEASLATSVPGSCSRPGRVAGVWGFDLRVLLVYLANRLDYWNVVQSFTIGFSSVYIYIIRFSHLYLWWLKIAKNSVGF